jgi:hypothetical protein
VWARKEDWEGASPASPLGWIVHTVWYSIFIFLSQHFYSARDVGSGKVDAVPGVSGFG